MDSTFNDTSFGKIKTTIVTGYGGVYHIW
jgi:hypothetical protein